MHNFSKMHKARPMQSKILVVDDQVSFCRHIKAILEQEGHEVHVAHDITKALEIFNKHPFKLLLIDLKLPNGNGLELFKKARNLDPDVGAIIMTAYSSIASAVESVKQGANDYLQKPFEPETLLLAVQRTLKEIELHNQLEELRQQVEEKYYFGNIVGKSHKMRILYQLIQKVAATNTRVFITGETGSGKELVAKAIHYNSPRKDKPFVGINCGAIPESLLESELFGYEKGAFTGAEKTKSGKFEYAQGGTIFLDEVGEISPRMQIELLRVLQELKFERVGGNESLDLDVRIISATNQDITQKLQKNEFRPELYYRLNVMPIHIPPLRERLEDIPLLVEHFITIFNKKFDMQVKNISSQALEKLLQYQWPGNVRELENVLERSFISTHQDILEEVIIPDFLASSQTLMIDDVIDPDLPYSTAKSLLLQNFEQSYFLSALEQCGYNVSAAAKKTGVSARTLWRKINAYDLKQSTPKLED